VIVQENVLTKGAALEKGRNKLISVERHDQGEMRAYKGPISVGRSDMMGNDWKLEEGHARTCHAYKGRCRQPSDYIGFITRSSRIDVKRLLRL
jgi:hypothetical protein